MVAASRVAALLAVQGYGLEGHVPAAAAGRMVAGALGDWTVRDVLFRASKGGGFDVSLVLPGQRQPRRFQPSTSAATSRLPPTEESA